jgi:hypothetical protein
MKINETIGSKEELRVFALLYCANADFEISHYEFEFIESGIGNLELKKLFEVFCVSNDYQIINKIRSSVKKLNYTKEDRETLFEDISEMFRLDTSGSILKLNLFRGLKRILN